MLVTYFGEWTFSWGADGSSGIGGGGSRAGAWELEVTLDGEPLGHQSIAVDCHTDTYESPAGYCAPGVSGAPARAGQAGQTEGLLNIR